MTYGDFPYPRATTEDFSAVDHIPDVGKKVDIMTESFPSEYLRHLQPNWDGYGALPPSLRSVVEARNIWMGLPGDGWQVVPVSGGVQIERHSGGVDVEISVVGCV